jgi:dTDP-glucose 4,6-dehydratase
MKTVLITGGAGFVGHHVIDYLIQNTDWNLIALDRLDYSGNLNRIADALKDKNVCGRVKVVYHDLKAEINKMVAREIGNANIILHLAAGSHVDRAIANPLEFVMDNVVGTCNILNFAKTLDGLELFLNFGTDEVFGPAPVGVNYKERDRYNSTNPYSATKAGAEELCVAFENTYRLPVVATHSMNIIGERQHPEKFIPMCIRKIMNGEIVTIHANKDCTKAGSRFYIHAKDVADALYFIITHRDMKCPVDFGGAKINKFNIVGQKELDNLTLASLLAQEVGLPLRYELVDFHSSRPGHDLRYSLSGELLKSYGWEPKEQIETRISEIVRWYKDNPEWLK